MLEKIEQDLKQAMLAGDKFKTTVLRNLKSALKNAQIELRKDTLSEEEIISTLKKLAKQLKDAVELYKSVNDTDRAEKEAKELSIIESYLPPQLSEAEIEERVKKIVKEIGVTSQKEFGKVIGQAMKELSSKADGSVVARITKKILNEK